MYSKIFVMDVKIRVGVNAMLGYRGVKIMAPPYKEDKILCSPTSALEKEQMLSKELRNRFVTDK
jgi:hypothetical protein